ncbi:MAG: recombinase family protein [Bdellovibrionota bacterium]
MRVLTYSRVSTSHHEQNPQVQVEELRRYCSARGWNISHEIVDHGFQGGTDNRPGLKQLLSLVRERQVDAVVVVKMDRLFRSLKHLITTLDEFEALGILFVATKDNVDYSTPSGKLFVQILGSLAEFEKSLVRERTMLGLAYARSRGQTLGRPVKHKPEEILALRQSGLSYRKICKQLGCSPEVVRRALKGALKTPAETGAMKKVGTGV